MIEKYITTGAMYKSSHMAQVNTTPDPTDYQNNKHLMTLEAHTPVVLVDAFVQPVLGEVTFKILVKDQVGYISVFPAGDDLETSLKIIMKYWTKVV